MAQRGTVANGVIVTEDSPPPEGTQVVFEPAEAFEYPHPMAPFERDAEIALLRKRIANMKAGASGIPLAEAMARIATELNLPRVDR